MPLIRFPTPTGLVYTIDLTKIADRANPRTVEAPISSGYRETTIIEWGDGTSDIISGNVNRPTHTYAEGAGDVFAVVMRSATGHLPKILFSGDSDNTATYSVTLAVTSVDHFAGWSGPDASGSYFSAFRNAANLRYYDARLTALPKWNSFLRAFQAVGIEKIQPGTFEFCSDNTNLAAAFTNCLNLTDIPAGLFDNQPNVTTINGLFNGCSYLTAIPAGLFDNCISLTDTDYAFNGCFRVEGAPYAFWNQSYAANITSKANTYRNCSVALKAQVPEDYGGTMTVG